MKIQEFIPKKSDESLLDKYANFEITYDKEIYPDDPDSPSELIKKAILEKSKEQDVFRWLVFSDTEDIIGYARLSYPNQTSPMYETNKNIADINIIVKKDSRRQGIGSELLRILVEKAKDLEKDTFQTITNLDAGRKFVEYYGGKIASDRCKNRLYFKDVNWEKMKKWCEEGEKRTPEVNIETFHDVLEEDIEEFVRVYTITENQAPDYETGDYKGLKITPESRRNEEQLVKGMDFIWTTKISRERDGTISGFTEIYHNEQIPHMIDQDMTGVLPEYRGRGLGRRLKAEMLFYIKENYPEAQYIETGNANNNKPMLAINHEMGFKKHISEYMMKLEIKEIEKKLEKK